MTSEIDFSDYLRVRKELENKNLSVKEVVNHFLENIEKEKELNAYITICKEKALKSAELSDKKFEKGVPRKLEGMIVAIKDNISTKGILTTCGSKMLENYEPVFDATVIERLESEGAIIIGKTNLDEFGMGSSNENSFFGKVLNPINREYVPGGSSGGSAVAVAANLCHVSLGSETGGSVRQPASFCGVYGLKPSYGSISRWGLVAYGSSLDQIGIFSKNLNENSLVFDVIGGNDPKDPTTTLEKKYNTLSELEDKPKKLKLGVLDENCLKYADMDVLKVYQDSMYKLERAGHELVELEFPLANVWIPTYYIISTAEASSNLSRYDGVLYGYREKDADKNFIKETRDNGFQAEVKRRILLGTYVLSAGHHEAYYIKALKARRKIKENYEEILDEADAIFLPTTPSAAFKFGEKSDNPVKMYMSDFYTAAANLAGIPAISIPGGQNLDGLPIGMQIQTARFKENEMYRIANQISEIISS